MSNPRLTTHAPGCWSWGPKHYECAVTEIERLRAEVDALAKDAAKYRWGINNARWIRSEHEAYVAIPVAREADLSCVAMRDAAIDAALIGECHLATRLDPVKTDTPDAL